jgi:hypothetical protein
MFGLLSGENPEVDHGSYRAKLRFTRHRGQISEATWSLLPAYDGLLRKLRAETLPTGIDGRGKSCIALNWRG